MIRVVVAEDSATVRRLLVEMLDSDPEIEVIGEARTGVEAVEQAARLTPDLVTMDIEMPEMDGLAATREIMASTPLPILIVTAVATEREGDLTFDATRAGALGVLPKPVDPLAPNFARQRDQLVSMAKAMAGVKVVRRRATAEETRRRRVATTSGEGAAYTGPPASRPLAARAEVLAIATSTGGPPALRDLLAALPTLPVPVVIVQHIARGFVGALAHWLAVECRKPVEIATQGALARPGTIYLAADDHHLGVARGPNGLGLVLSDAPAIGGFRPSGTYLFESAAQAVGGGVVAVILTGMGNDGVAGLQKVRARGGRILAQDEATSVIYGMPREAVRAGVVDAVLPLPDIARHVAQLVEGA